MTKLKVEHVQVEEHAREERAREERVPEEERVPGDAQEHMWEEHMWEGYMEVEDSAGERERDEAEADAYMVAQVTHAQEVVGARSSSSNAATNAQTKASEREYLENHVLSVMLDTGTPDGAGALREHVHLSPSKRFGLVRSSGFSTGGVLGGNVQVGTAFLIEKGNNVTLIGPPGKKRVDGALQTGLFSIVELKPGRSIKGKDQLLVLAATRQGSVIKIHCCSEAGGFFSPVLSKVAISLQDTPYWATEEFYNSQLTSWKLATAKKHTVSKPVPRQVTSSKRKAIATATKGQRSRAKTFVSSEEGSDSSLGSDLSSDSVKVLSPVLPVLPAVMPAASKKKAPLQRQNVVEEDRVASKKQRFVIPEEVDNREQLMKAHHTVRVASKKQRVVSSEEDDLEDKPKKAVKARDALVAQVANVFEFRDLQRKQKKRDKKKALKAAGKDAAALIKGFFG